MIRISILTITLATLTITGCKSKDDSGGSGGATKATEAKGGPTALPKLGLQIDVPGKVTIGDALLGEGHMLQGSGVGAMQVELASKAQTLGEAKEDADMYSPKNVQAETLADGWALTYENTGGAGKNYFVKVQREIDGKAIACSTTGGNAGQAQAVLAACKTLRK
jgi:hypothetical protein